MNGYASFNQVFFTDAKVEPEFLVSEVGDGWAVTTTTLMHERRGADGLRSWAIASDKPGRAYDEEREEIRTTMEPYKWDPQRAGRVDLIVGRARATGRSMIRYCGRRSPRCWRCPRLRNRPLAAPAQRRSRVGRGAPRALSASWRPASSPERRLACIPRCRGRMHC